MKKAMVFLLIFLIALCSGCTLITDDLSSGTYYNNSSEYIIDYDIVEFNEDFVQNQSQIVDNSTNDSELSTNEIEANEDSNTNTEVDNIVPPTVIIDENIDTSSVEKIPAADINTTGEKPLYYTRLTKSQQQIYSYMKTAAEQMKTGLFSIGATTQSEDRFSDISIAFRALSGDNPQIFWLPNVYIISSDGSAMAFSYEEKGNDYSFTIEQKQEAENMLEIVVNNLVLQANKYNSRFEKEVFFHDWLCENVTYDANGSNSVYTAYGALVDGVAVCEGYSRAMQLLCDAVGIPCTVVYGSSQGRGHMWNIIDVGDGWCHLDVTWDDDEEYGVVRHAYVNLSDEQILQDHTIFDAVKSGISYSGTDDFNLYIYDCQSEQYNYFFKNGLVIDDDLDEVAKIIIDASKSHTSIELLYTGSCDDYTGYLNRVNRAIFENGSNIWMKNYSVLNNALMLWW